MTGNLKSADVIELLMDLQTIISPRLTVLYECAIHWTQHPAGYCRSKTWKDAPLAPSYCRQRDESF